MDRLTEGVCVCVETDSFFLGSVVFCVSDAPPLAGSVFCFNVYNTNITARINKLTNLETESRQNLLTDDGYRNNINVIYFFYLYKVEKNKK